MKNTFLDKLLHRLDRVGSDDLQNYLQQLAREKGFLETVFNTLQEGIVVIDGEGRILYANHGAEHLLGIAAEEALQQPVSRYLREIPWDTILAEPRVISRDLEVDYPEKRLLHFNFVPLEEDHVKNGHVLIFRDITNTRAETEETIESEKMTALTLLAAGVAHELGNPLNSLNIHFQLLERDLREIAALDKPAIAESWQVLRGELSRLDSIISHFLRAIRPAAPDLKLDNLNAVLAEAVDFLRPEITDRDVHVETSFAADIPPLFLDRDQLKQAFYNLIKNALQAMPPGGTLEVSTERTDTHLIARFADNGSGIAPDKIGQIFEPYFTTKPSGSGLGLLIVRRIVRSHGGELQLESHEGKGTVVQLLFPLLERRVRLLPGATTENT